MEVLGLSYPPSWTRDGTRVSPELAGGFFTSQPPGKPYVGSFKGTSQQLRLFFENQNPMCCLNIVEFAFTPYLTEKKFFSV